MTPANCSVHAPQDVGFYAIDPCKQQHIRGLLNITAPMAVGPAGNGSAAYGAPILVSPPHYCGADSSLRKGVVGLPGCQGVDTQLVYIDVEPMTGACVVVPVCLCVCMCL